MVVKTIFFLSSLLIMACQGAMIIPVQIGQKASLPIPLIQLENGTRIGWFYCRTKNCYPHWNKHFLAEIIFKTKACVDDPNFVAYLNGTLVVKKVPPSYDGRNFMARVHLNGAGKTYTYHLKINKGSPKLTLVSPQVIYVYVGMGLYLEAEVEGYPYPWVSLSHDEHVLQNRSNFRSSKILRKVNSNITKANGGLYTICAGNAYGNRCLIMRVHVQDIPIPTLPPSSGDVPRSDASDCSKSPPPDEESKVDNAIIFTLLIWCIGIIVILLVTCAILVWLLIKKKHCQYSRNQQQRVLPGLTPEYSVGSDSDDGKRSTAAGGDSSRYITTQVPKPDPEDVFENEGRRVLSAPTCEHSFGTDSGDGEGSTGQVFRFDSRAVFESVKQGESL